MAGFQVGRHGGVKPRYSKTIVAQDECRISRRRHASPGHVVQLGAQSTQRASYGTTLDVMQHQTSCISSDILYYDRALTGWASHRHMDELTDAGRECTVVSSKMPCCGVKCSGLTAPHPPLIPHSQEALSSRSQLLNWRYFTHPHRLIVETPHPITLCHCSSCEQPTNSDCSLAKS